MIRLRAAKLLLQTLGITDPRDIDLEAIAFDRGALVRLGALDECEARIVGYDSRAVITVDDRKPRTRQQFSAAHELGHWHALTFGSVGVVPELCVTVSSRCSRPGDNLARTHSRRCRSLPGSEAALRYYQIFNCVVQLVTVGRSRAQGTTAHGVYNSPVGVANLINHAHLLTGLNLSPPA